MAEDRYFKRYLHDPKDWGICPVCDGKASYMTEGDAHRSGGEVPCYYCNKDGLVAYETIKVITRKERA